VLPFLQYSSRFRSDRNREEHKMSFPLRITEVCYKCHRGFTTKKIVETGRQFCSMRCHYQWRQEQQEEKRKQEEIDQLTAFGEAD
jgi:wyosine [tRNA(Phe)-imidazoG37] synthetase (radical SAM superfamily)